MKRFSLCILILVVALVLASQEWTSGPGTARAAPPPGWSEPLNVSKTSAGSLQPNFVLDSSGAAHVVWTEAHPPGEIYYSKVASGVATTGENISNTAGASFSQSIAIDGSGTLHAIWTDQNEGDGDPYYASKPAGGSWSGHVNIYPTWLYSPETNIAAESNGDLHVIWSQAMGAAGDIYYCYKPASASSWSGTCGDLDEGNWGWPSTSNAELAVDNNGTVHMIQRYELNEGDNLGVAYRSKPRGGSWSGLQVISDSPSSGQAPTIAVDSSGAAYSVWVDDRLGNNEIYYATNADGSWSTPVNVSQSSGDSNDPRIAVDSTGTVHVVWEEGPEGSREIRYASKPLGGSWPAPSGIVDVSNTSGDSILPWIAIGGSNHVHVMWSDSTTGNYEIYYSATASAVKKPQTPFERCQWVKARIGEVELGVDIAFLVADPGGGWFPWGPSDLIDCGAPDAPEDIEAVSDCASSYIASLPYHKQWAAFVKWLLGGQPVKCVPQ